MDDNFQTKSVGGETKPASTQRIFAQEDIKPSSSIKDFYRHNKWYVWAIVGALAVIGILAFLAFRSQPAEPTKEANVNLSIDLPETVPSSGDFVFRVTVENRESAKLVDLNLEVVYPDGAEYVSSSPESRESSGTSFEIPDLLTNQNATISIKARMQGGINEVKEFNARLRYRYDNFNSNFEKRASAETRLSAAGILLEIEGPVQITPSEQAVYEIKYANNSELDVSRARIQMEYPDGFTFGKAEPSPDLAKNVWNLPSLSKGSSGSIRITGGFAGAGSGESKIFKAQFLVLDQSGSFFPQAETQYMTQISKLPLNVSQTLEQSNSGIANPGDTLNYRIRYQNNGQTPARGVNIVVTLDSKALDLNSIEGDNAQVSGNTITWNAASVAALENVSPAEGGDLRFRVSVKNPAVKDSSKNLFVKSTIKIKSDEQEEFLPGNTLETKIATVASLVRSVTHVSGNLPPKVGNDTVYRITLALRNSTNDLSSTQVTAFIPLDPSSFDASSITGPEATKVTFDKSTGKLVWNVGTLPAHTGDFSAPRTLQFNLRLRPTSAQAGNSVILLRTIAATAKDSYTGQSVRLTQEDLSTRHIPDADYTNNGTVVR